MNRQQRRAFLSVLWHTLRHAPHLVERVVEFTIIHITEANRMLPALCDALDKEVALESAEGFQLATRQGNPVLPERFIRFHKELFPEIHQRLHHRLTDKSRTNEALVRVFSEFASQCDGSLEQLEERHQTLLRRLSDRIIASLNIEHRSPTVTLPGDEEPVWNRSELAQNVLDAVQQEYRALSYNDAARDGRQAASLVQLNEG